MANPRPQNGNYYTQTDPAMDKYRPAWDTLKANSFVNNPSLSDRDRIYLRSIQGTYKVKLEHLADRGHGFQMMLVWDYDRIWGVFDFGSYKGVLMVDHGPDREPPEFSRDVDSDEEDEAGPDPIYFDFTWRGTSSHMPDTIINNSLITKGKIAFGTSEISGYFEGPIADGRPEGRCNFHGQPPFGPRRVPRNLESFIDDWNELNIFEEDESFRPEPTS
ncbi:hypothetical protein PFICI_11588 [Pestalotiopsis fici W106-1]|uniref:Uncharacterized protein n=1 Tax=Pestalotiopsis fici (strain W106-1 / CGMCC3.15140) TaxID=1229662 RepID=W3WTN6_PESFW|nr:uncharacterized protein PFICI_11588 [Pestalotiopsis fici W106-1]ETS76201.1 hypothetical protein PFICI_11588 [Pestalotiopsis fici W106-1]